jgi:hypothetical protein
VQQIIFRQANLTKNSAGLPNFAVMRNTLQHMDMLRARTVLFVVQATFTTKVLEKK